MKEGEAQVAQALLNFWNERGAETCPKGGKMIRGIVRHRDLADYIGSDRSTVGKHLSELKKEGVIWYPSRGQSPNRLTILDVPTLQRKALAR
jgi:DNA-binding MarR family transcriptional regulator